MTNANLTSARKAKQDEFYTQWSDIELEMNAYLDYNSDVFRDRVILLPCDDPTWSNFTKFFALHFEDYGIKKLISTSYAPNSNNNGVFYKPPKGLFDEIIYDKDKDMEKGKIFTLERKDTNMDGKVNIDDLEWRYLDGDGDFRSDEIKSLRDEADMVITNPPFSLFREFVTWLIEGDVGFSVIGNMNAITYKDVFPLIKDNKMWLGAIGRSNASIFRVPSNITERSGFTIDEKGNKYMSISGVWLTNIEHGRRHQPLNLLTMEQNKRFNKRIINNDSSYQKYDNYAAIEVPVTAGIPSDWGGVMGVPISFLDKYSPEQFEIIGLIAGNIRGLAGIPTTTGKDGPYINGKLKYGRILIRHLTPETQETKTEGDPS